jgi:hypothetical protein
MTIYFIKEGYTHVKCNQCHKKFKVGDPYTTDGIGKKNRPLFRHVACLPPERQEMTETAKKKAPVKKKRVIKKKGGIKK